MLWTMRSGNELNDVIKWFSEHGIELWGINENPLQKETGWSVSHKQHANLYIDDATLNAPLKYDYSISDKPFLDWVRVEEELKKLGLL